MRAKAAAREIALHVESAGTGGWHQGEGADPRMVRAAARRGYDLSAHRAKKVAVADFYEFDRLLAMDRRNRADLQHIAPQDRVCDIRLFLDFAGGGVRETPDPYYGGPEAFERVLDLLEAASDRFLSDQEGGCGRNR